MASAIKSLNPYNQTSCMKNWYKYCCFLIPKSKHDRIIIPPVG